MLCLRCYCTVGWDNHYLEEKTSFGVFFIFWLFGCWWNENLTQGLGNVCYYYLFCPDVMRWRACGTLFMDGELGQFPGLKKTNPWVCIILLFQSVCTCIPLLNLHRKLCAGNSIVSNLQGRESRHWAVMQPAEGHRMNEWWHEHWLPSVAPDITLFSTRPRASLEALWDWNPETLIVGEASCFFQARGCFSQDLRSTVTVCQLRPHVTSQAGKNEKTPASDGSSWTSGI